MVTPGPAPISLGPCQFASPLLEVRELTARIEGRTVLKQLSLQLGARGIYTLMGPGGSGKSSLLGILSGRNRAGSGWTLEGEVRYQGTVLGLAARPAVIAQRLARPAVRLRDYLLGELGEAVADAPIPESLAEQLLQQLDRVQLTELGRHLEKTLGHDELRLSESQWRRLALARELIADPPLLCADEPTAGLDEAEAAPILAALHGERQRRAVLMITHHQQQARDYSDYLILLAGGCVQEYGPTAVFFARPQSVAAQTFIRTGGCAVPSPDANDEQLEPAAPAGAPEMASGGPAAGAESAAAPVPISPPLPVAREARPPAPAVALPIEVRAPESLALRLRGFGLQLGGRVLLAELNLDVAARGVHLLITSSATDKRLLLRALCGPRPDAFKLLGEARYLGRALTTDHGPVTPLIDARLAVLPAAEYLTSQLPLRSSLASGERAAQALAILTQAGWPELGARLAVPMCDLEPHERRVLEILGSAAPAPALLILDEPLAGVGPDELPRLLLLLQQQAMERALLLLVQEAGPLPQADWQVPPQVGWLVDGRILGSPPPLVPPPAREPPPAASTQCLMPPPDPSPRSESVDTAAAFLVDPSQRKSRGSGPRGFHWLRWGVLAGMPAPGLTQDLDYDLGLIRAAGISHLVTLTGEPLPPAALREHSLQSLFFPITDMEAPAFESAAELVQQVATLVAQGLPVGFHCKAGLGRTGTMLAAQLVWEGLEAGAALAQVRRIEPGWVQSDKQERFLYGFQDWLQQRRLTRQPPP